MEGMGSLLSSMSKYVLDIKFCQKARKELFFHMQKNYPRLSVAAAGDRKFDVYMGIDVFGRGTYGGGQWNVWLVLIL